jgi:LPS export ABC transporter permease LptF/LPS export ABC transporter permease LptG
MSRMASLSLRPTILDRYILREMLPPTGLGLLVFTFVLLINEIPRLLAILVARSADLSTILRVFLNLLPSIFAVTIPMAFLLGVLLAFGRLASDSEIVALRATGVSPLRLLGPVLMLSAITGLLTFYINAVALPAANQAHRELVFSLVVTKARTVVKPRTFTDELLPGRMMLYVSDISPETGDWKNVFIHDSREPDTPKVILARTGRLVIDKNQRAVTLHLGPGTQHTFPRSDPAKYEESQFQFADFPLPYDEFFPRLPLAKGDREMTLPELQAAIRDAQAKGKPAKEYARFAVEWHKKFAIPTACLVFGLLGLGLSLGSRKEARSAAFALAIGVIFVYYVFLRMGEQAGDNGMVSPFLAMWTANIVLGAAAVALLALNNREAAFDPLDPTHYLGWVPKVRRAALSPGAGSPRPPAPRAAVVVRIPRVVVSFPTLLDRYIGRSYFGHFLLVLAGFVSIFTLAEFLDLFNDIQENKVRGVVVVHFYAFHLLAIINLVAPVAILVGVLVTFGVLARRNEITAMKAGGISVYRAAAPLLGVGLLLSLSLYLAQEFVLPSTNRIAALDFNVIKGRPPQSSGFLDRRWILSSDNKLYNYDYLVERQNPAEAGIKDLRSRPEFALFGLSIYDVDGKTWSMRERVFASRAAWNPASVTYDLERGWRRSLEPPRSFRSFDLERVRALGRDPGGEIDPPRYFRREEKPSDTLGFAELRAHIASLEALGFDTVPLQVQLHRKLAFPAVGLIMTLLGIPFSFTVARRGALYGIGASVVIAIVYWACLGIFEALGNNALLPPLLAAWAPNLIFGAAGLYLMLTLET